MSELIYCHECGDEFKKDDMFYIGGGEYICEYCRDYYYLFCEDCGELVHERDIVPIDDRDRYVCENCASEYYRCNYCGEMYSEVAVNNYDFTLCEHCYNEYYFTCEECGEVYYIDDGERLGDSYYCYHCAEEYHCIHSYTYKPMPRFYGGNVGYGVELEIDNGNNRRDAARDIIKAGRDHIYLKEDGSLSTDGFEIVTHPATLEYHMKEFPWKEIVDTAREYEYKSHDTNTCGLHIHASRELFGHGRTLQDLNIAKCMLLIDAYWHEYIIPFSRRDYDRLERWANKPNAGITTNDDEYIAIDKAKKAACKGRYQAINLQNYNTVEFRFFRGTLRRDTIIASIQFLDTLINYAKKTKLKDIFNKSFLEIFGNTGYPELTEYLQLRKLTKKEVN